MGVAVLVLAGWALTLTGWLGASGYCVIGGAMGIAAAVVVWRGRGQWTVRCRPRRWRRGWPAAFLVLAGLAALGAGLHAPSNIDALTYRLPRVLHWLDAGRWHWIETTHLRMNYNATATEWLVAPLLALRGPARMLAWPNLLAFFLLPGLLFTWLRGLGVGGRAAWRWMWLTPAALGFALQAGSLANDLLGAVAFLAALVFAQRARQQRSACWVVLAALAFALATNVKASNLALAPMVATLWWPAWRALPARRGWVGGIALGLGVAVSVLPTLALNLWHSGHWSGDPENFTRVRPGSAVAALTGNFVQTLLQNLAPPFLPGAGGWNVWSDAVLLPWWRETFGAAAFSRFTLRISEAPQEEWAGLGLCFVALLALEAWLARGRWRPLPPGLKGFLWAGGGGGLLFGATMGSEMPARLLLPWAFTPIAFVAVLASGVDVRQRAVWRAGAGATLVVAMLAVGLTPARPLFPSQAVLGSLQRWWPESAGVARAARVYAVYAARADLLGEVRGELCRNETMVGFLATDDDSEWSLWQAGGLRRVVHVNTLGDPRLGALRVLVVRGDAFWPDEKTETAVLEQAGFRVDARHFLVVKAARPAERWLVARRRD